MTTKDKMIAVLLSLIVAGIIYGWWYKSQRDDQAMRMNNTLGALIPLQHVNDSLAFKIAEMVPAEEIQKHLDKESQLARRIKSGDERILALQSANTVTRVDSFPVLFTKILGTAWAFDKQDRWYHVAGIADSMGLFFDTFETRDSLTFAFTQSKDGILYGYIANHSPYNHILNANFLIDSKQYYTAPWFRWDGFGIVGGVRFPGGYFGVDVKGTLWNQVEISPRFVSDGKAFEKSLEARWRLPIFK